MRVLFVHRAFPGQLGPLAARIAARWPGSVTGVGERRFMTYAYNALPFAASLVGYEIAASTGPRAQLLDCLSRGSIAAKAASDLRAKGYRPDVIMGHTGWGELVYLREVFPDAKIIGYADVFLRKRYEEGCDDFLNLNEDYHSSPETNAPILMALDICDTAVTQTEWQKSTFPAYHQERMAVIHDGIDTDAITPGDGAEDELVTYAAPTLEPVRGFHVFMRALPELLRLRPKARVVIVGNDDIRYSPALPNGVTYRSLALRELDGRLDMSRITFLPHMAHDEFIALLRRSAAHVYLTVPHVLSWSAIEAMSAGCLIVGSNTAPVREVITNGVNGLLVEHPNPEALAEKIGMALEHRNDLGELRAAARRTAVERYDLKRVCLPQQVKLVEAMAG